MQGAQNLRSEAYLQVRCNDEGEAQRRRWIFYETIKEDGIIRRKEAMEHFKEPAEKKDSSTKSLNELMNLLMKLNAKLREKISPSKKKDIAPGKMDVVIIIMTNPEEKPKTLKTTRHSKPESLRGEWIQDLCDEIERGPQAKK